MFGLWTAVLIFHLCAAVLIFGLCMHKISTASSASTVVICTLYNNTALLCFGLCSHKINTASSAGTVVASIFSTNVLIFGMSSQHFPSSASFIQCMCMWNHKVNHKGNVTLESTYAVLSQIWIVSDLRAFCAKFLSHKMCLCYFLRFLHVWLLTDSVTKVRYRAARAAKKAHMNQ